jgi:hypothetical protein
MPVKKEPQLMSFPFEKGRKFLPPKCHFRFIVVLDKEIGASRFSSNKIKSGEN